MALRLKKKTFHLAHAVFYCSIPKVFLTWEWVATMLKWWSSSSSCSSNTSWEKTHQTRWRYGEVNPGNHPHLLLLALFIGILSRSLGFASSCSRPAKYHSRQQRVLPHPWSLSCTPGCTVCYPTPLQWRICLPKVLVSKRSEVGTPE